jgi:hypothetical protein
MPFSPPPTKQWRLRNGNAPKFSVNVKIHRTAAEQRDTERDHLRQDRQRGKKK